MCCSPIIIKNPSRKYRDGIDKMFFRVPCCTCKECLKKEQDDWFVRAFFEWLRIKNCGGAVFFPTFTYDDDHLPWFCDDLRGYSIPCFNDVHLKRLRDSFRVYAYRYFVKKFKKLFQNKNLSIDEIRSLASETIKSVRFIFVPEFGGKKGRPHYHALIFCPFNISDRAMLHLLRKSWKNGFVGVSKHGLRLKTQNGLQYAMKYTSKEQHWRKLYKVDDYIAQLKEEIENGRVESEYELKHFKSLLPHHRQSILFGSSMCDYIKNRDDILVKDRVDLSEFGFVTSNKFSFSLPRYIKNKLFYVADKYGLNVPNEKYLSLLRTIFDYQIENLRRQYSPFQSFEAFSEHCRMLNIPKSDMNVYWRVLEPVKDMHSQMAAYNLALRDVPVDINYEFSTNVDPIDFAFDFLFKQKKNFSVPTPENCAPCITQTYLFHHKRRKFGDLVQFVIFENALKIIEDLNNKINSLSNESWFKEEERKVNTFQINHIYFFNSI